MVKKLGKVLCMFFFAPLDPVKNRAKYKGGYD